MIMIVVDHEKLFNRGSKRDSEIRVGSRPIKIASREIENLARSRTERRRVVITRSWSRALARVSVRWMALVARRRDVPIACRVHVPVARCGNVPIARRGDVPVRVPGSTQVARRVRAPSLRAGKHAVVRAGSAPSARADRALFFVVTERCLLVLRCLMARSPQAAWGEGRPSLH